MKKQMMLIRSTLNEKPTFKLIPMSLDCPFLESIFDPEKKTLGIISKTSYQSIRMVPRIDSNGEVIPYGSFQDKKVKMERVQLESFYDYELSHPGDIMHFIHEMADVLPSISFEEIVSNYVSNEQTT